MVLRRLSVALDEDVAREAMASAAREGLSLSAWLNRVAARALRTERGLVAVADWEVEHGGFTANEIAAAEAELDGIDRRRARRRS